MCACCSFAPTCPAILPCGTGPCWYTCPPPAACCQPVCPPPTPCTPCPTCDCSPIYRPRPAPLVPDIVGPTVPMLPTCKPRRCCYVPPDQKPDRRPVVCPPVLPCCPPPEPCDPPPVQPCVEPTPCVQPVLPCCNPACPTPILPKQRPICPRNLPCPCPCVPVSRGCCQYCELDPVTRRRPLIVSDSLFHKRPACRPGECFQRKNPGVRYTLTNYTQENPELCSNIYHVDVPLI
ncbi:uncharacterized protein [Choristoneura fumiferana]|uniref:uncharacterized protein n=1 Tax=Choristoneura fumiferana TaxID=7141 RepID=UPI003D154660